MDIQEIQDLMSQCDWLVFVITGNGYALDDDPYSPNYYKESKDPQELIDFVRNNLKFMI